MVNMTNREYIASITDEFEKLRYIAELARQYPEYEKLPTWKRQDILKKILDAEVVLQTE